MLYSFSLKLKEGELGLGNTNQQLLATLIPLMKNSIDITAGSYFTLVLTNDSKVYGFGRNIVHFIFFTIGWRIRYWR